MIAEIVSIGTELIMGQVVNSDAQFLSKKLPELGIGVYRHVAVGDNPGRMLGAINDALSRADLVITTGGLGPTQDDITKDIVAEALRLEMVRDEDTVAKLEGFFAGRTHKMTPNNLRQAWFPKGAYIMKNRRGTAPGCIVTRDNGEKKQYVAVLPGPPHELKDMAEQELFPFLARLCEYPIVSRFVKTVGIGESDLETRLMDLFEGDNPSMALYCSPGEVQARITVRQTPGVDAQAILNQRECEMRSRLGEAIYTIGQDSLEQTVLNLLFDQKMTLAVAESCTGGELCSRIVACPGASRVLLGGCVTYSDAMKRTMLGVNAKTLNRFGAVSEQTAREMADGMRKLSGADYALSTTGIAGPGGGTDDKPIGLVFIALATASGTEVKKLNLFGDRTRMRGGAVLNALNLLRLTLIHKDGGERYV